VTAPEDPEIEAYRRRLKQRSPIRVSPFLVMMIAAPLVGIGGAAYVAWRANERANPAPSPPAPPTPESLLKTALQSVATTYAPLEADSLEEASVELARGRKVCFVQQSRAFDPETARLLGSPLRSKTSNVMLPDGFDPGIAGAFATQPNDVGVVVLVRETMRRVGTYTGGNEPAMETQYDAVAVLVPEAKRLARFSHLALPPTTATRMGTGKDSFLVGGLTHDDGAWMRDAATALHDGRAPAR
jgi:hypothetical protein